mgnify:CR=1 FL=1
MVDAIMFESVYYYKQWSIINNHNVLIVLERCSKARGGLGFLFIHSFLFYRFSFFSLSLNSSLLSTMIISRRIPLSFVAAAAAVAAAALALELQKKIHLVASSQE